MKKYKNALGNELNKSKINFILSMKIVLFLFLQFSLTEIGYSQEAEWEPLTRQVKVDYNDSLVRAQILIQPAEIKTYDNLMYFWYNQQTINKNMGGYDGDLLHGEFLVFDKKKNLITKGIYAYGLRNNIWKYWNSEGVLLYTSEYKEGLLDGDYVKYGQNGEIVLIQKYQKGKLQLEQESRLKIWSSTPSELEKSDTNKIEQISNE